MFWSIYYYKLYFSNTVRAPIFFESVNLIHKREKLNVKKGSQKAFCVTKLAVYSKTL